MTEALQVTEKPKFVPPEIREITTWAEYEYMAEALKDQKDYQTRVTAFFGPHKKRAYDLWRGLCEDEALALKPSEAAEVQMKTRLVTFYEKQEALRLADERRQAEEARQKEEQRRLEEAAALELEAQRTGDADLKLQAEQIMEEPVETPTVQLSRESYVPKVSGLSYRASYSAKVTDLLKFLKWVVANPANLNLVSPNQAALNQMARAQKERFKMDGVQLMKGKVPASGR